MSKRISSISNLYADYYKHPKAEKYAEMLPQAGAAMLVSEEGKIELSGIPPALINVAASFLIWRKSKNRTVWRVTPPTADYLRSVSLSFIPELSPPSWSGDCICVESTEYSKPLLHNIFSLACYRGTDMNGKKRYFFVYMKYPDGIAVFSISADLSKLNRKMAESGEIFGRGFVTEKKIDFKGQISPEMMSEAYDIIRFVFAASYLADSPERVGISVSHGPVKREGKKKKPVKKGGKVVPLWTYSNLKVRERKENHRTGERKALDTDGLELQPVIVSPHIRRYGEKAVIVDQYDSHRWRKQNVAGVKKTI